MIVCLEIDMGIGRGIQPPLFILVFLGHAVGFLSGHWYLKVNSYLRRKLESSQVGEGRMSCYDDSRSRETLH